MHSLPINDQSKNNLIYLAQDELSNTFNMKPGDVIYIELGKINGSLGISVAVSFSFFFFFAILQDG